MNLITLLSSYSLWHYTTALSDIFRIWGNFLWFVYNFFSIPLLLKTFFSPWRRLREEKKQAGLHPGEFFGNLIVNVLMRIIGIFVRLITIVVGLCILFLVFLSGIAAFVLWLATPLLLPILIIIGLKMLLL